MTPKPKLSFWQRIVALFKGSPPQRRKLERNQCQARRLERKLAENLNL